MRLLYIRLSLSPLQHLKKCIPKDLSSYIVKKEDVGATLQNENLCHVYIHENKDTIIFW